MGEIPPLGIIELHQRTPDFLLLIVSARNEHEKIPKTI